MDKFAEMILISKSEEYLKRNPDRLNNSEKQKFREDLKVWIDGTSDTIDDEVYDFLVALETSGRKPREEIFASHITKKYSNIKFRQVLDVGAGRMCKLSSVLSKLGYQMRAIDPKIRLLPAEAKRLGIKSISTSKFLCDEFSKNGKGFDISSYDLILGLEPCDATEHIIRQALKYDKAFEILLCAAAHDSLDGRKFRNYLEWYEHLRSISSEIEITKKGSSYYASNEKQL